MKDPNAKESQKSPHFPDSFHRVVIKGLYVQEGKLLLCHDFEIRDQPPIWELPGGGLDFGESVPTALAREVKEEMGLTVTSVAPMPSHIWSNKREHARGMEWYYVFILAYRFDVASLNEFTPTDECREMKFFSKEELRALSDLAPQIAPLIELFDPADFA